MAKNNSYIYPPGSSVSLRQNRRNDRETFINRKNNSEEEFDVNSSELFYARQSRNASMPSSTQNIRTSSGFLPLH